MLVRGPSLESSMSHYLIQRIEDYPNISVRTCTEVVDTLGEDDHLTGSGHRQPADRRDRDAWTARECAASSAPSRAPTGSRRSSPATTTASSWPDRTCATSPAGPWTGRRTTWNKRARGVCCRGCPRRVGQASGRRGRRGFDGSDAGAPLSGRGLIHERREGETDGRKMRARRTADAVPVRGADRRPVATRCARTATSRSSSPGRSSPKVTRPPVSTCCSTAKW